MQPRPSNSEIFGDFEGFRQVFNGALCRFDNADPSTVVIGGEFAWDLHCLDCEARSTLDSYLLVPRTNTEASALAPTDQDDDIVRILDDCHKAVKAFFDDFTEDPPFEYVREHATNIRTAGDRLAVWWARHRTDLQQLPRTSAEICPAGPTRLGGPPWSDISDAACQWKFDQRRKEHEAQSEQPYRGGRPFYWTFSMRTAAQLLHTRKGTWSMKRLGSGILNTLHAWCDDLRLKLNSEEEPDFQPFLQFLSLNEDMSDCSDSEGSSEVDTKSDGPRANLIGVLRKTYALLESRIRSDSHEESKHELQSQLQLTSDTVDDLAKSWLIEHGRLTADMSDGLDRDSLWEYVHLTSRDAAPPSTE